MRERNKSHGLDGAQVNLDQTATECRVTQRHCLKLALLRYLLFLDLQSLQVVCAYVQEGVFVCMSSCVSSCPGACGSRGHLLFGDRVSPRTLNSLQPGKPCPPPTSCLPTTPALESQGVSPFSAFCVGSAALNSSSPALCSTLLMGPFPQRQPSPT